jgi:hypothetical protein
MYVPSSHQSTTTPRYHLLVIILSLVVDDVEESELVDTLGSRDNPEPISQLLLLEELLCAANQIY